MLMIQPQTYLGVADNSGGKELMCIRVLGSGRRVGRVGQLIVGVIKEAVPNMPIKRSDVVRAVIVRTSFPIQRRDGSCLRFDDNAAVIVTKENNPSGTRVFGPLAREVKEQGFSKIVSLAPEII